MATKLVKKKKRIPYTPKYPRPRLSDVLEYYSGQIRGLSDMADDEKRCSRMAFDAMVDSIKQCGLRKPLIVDDEDRLVDGRTRLRALFHLKRSLSEDDVDLEASIKATLDEEGGDELSPEETYTSFLDSPEMKALAAENRREKYRERLTTPVSEQLEQFLKRCKRRGSPYRGGHNNYPTQTQLAKYCGVHASSIYRIWSGQQQSVQRNVYDILLAVSCISPKPPTIDPHQEMLRRVADADACVAKNPAGGEVVLEAILAGIESRIDDFGSDVA